MRPTTRLRNLLARTGGRGAIHPARGPREAWDRRGIASRRMRPTTRLRKLLARNGGRGASFPARGPRQSVGIDGELRVDAGGRNTGASPHFMVNEAEALLGYHSRRRLPARPTMSKPK